MGSAESGGVSPAESGQNFLRILVDPVNANIDVIAIHGLNPLNKQSHAEATWTSEDKLWLRDFLPKRAPRARICLFGYNSNVAFGSSTAGIREQAENLLNHLEQIRAGRNHVGLGDIAAGIARCVTRNPENTFMAALRSNSQMLCTITDDFRQMLKEFQIISFYKTRPLGRLGIVVDPKAAVLRLPRTRERQIPIDSDHKEICKFASDKDPRYKIVEDNIAQMIKCATSQVPHRHDSVNISHADKSNISRITGDANIVTQAGQQNRSVTIGEENNTGQFGRENNCEVTGKRNLATQTTQEVSAVLLLLLRLILDKWGFPKW
ncbi:hypothetical protein E0Z10_g5747 [Xylaria hypoxylon]|uniref:Uncharacterized protein n=1 Tax=Xylaria hypoxylon TaxID=37992 RepID=A0A4Z0Z075_9PEZI|nr:hypothetical protein E0Z10_g5747 [Xylaria hypoxylon]